MTKNGSSGVQNYGLSVESGIIVLDLERGDTICVQPDSSAKYVLMEKWWDSDNT